MTKHTVLLALALLALASCGSSKQEAATAAPDEGASEITASASDKAKVDAVGGDLVKLAKIVRSPGTPGEQLYAECKLVAAFAATTDAKAAAEAFELLPGGNAKIAGFGAKTRLSQQ